MLSDEHRSDLVSKKRTLTESEIKIVTDDVSNRQHALFSGHMITVSVQKETDDNGIPIVNITRINEAVITDIVI